MKSSLWPCIIQASVERYCQSSDVTAGRDHSCMRQADFFSFTSSCIFWLQCCMRYTWNGFNCTETSCSPQRQGKMTEIEMLACSVQVPRTSFSSCSPSFTMSKVNHGNKRVSQTIAAFDVNKWIPIGITWLPVGNKLTTAPFQALSREWPQHCSTRPFVSSACNVTWIRLNVKTDSLFSRT